MKRLTRHSIILAVFLAGGFGLFLYLLLTPSITNPNLQKGPPAASFSTSGTLATTARYTVNSSPTGQWLVVQADSPVSSVSASDSGTIPAYGSLASLNQTSIGYECSQKTADGACSSSEYIQQTGWFWDSADHTLTVHYLGGSNVTLTVIEKP